MSKSKGPNPPGPPVRRFQDMSLSDVSKMQLEALEKGNLGPVIDTLKASIDPDPEPEPPTSYLVTVPLVGRDGLPTVGAAIQVAYSGVGADGELRLPSGEVYKVNLVRLASVLDALRTAIMMQPPPPAIYGPFRGR
jgi:hypothetical protein